MTTYWTADVTVDDRCVVIENRDTLTAALSHAITDCIYYLGIYPGKAITIAQVIEHCRSCENTGKVLRRGRRWVRCADCKGKGATGRLDPAIEVHLPNAANRIEVRSAFPPRLGEAGGEISPISGQAAVA